MSVAIYIAVMAVVTYIIRMVPFTFFRRKIKSRFVRSFLKYIPYAVLSAMTIPAIFYSTGSISKHMKVGAAVVTCRRGGNTASFDVLNKYFTISGMPVASSTYWNQVHGFTAEDVRKDLEGLQVMRNLARNMAFLMRAIAAEKERSGYPVMERKVSTSFPDGK